MNPLLSKSTGVSSDYSDRPHRVRLLVAIVSWNRPHFLRATLESLFRQLAGVPADVVVVDNGSDDETHRVIEQESRLARRVFLDTNLGINAALEAVLPAEITEAYDAILISDADMEYCLPIPRLLPLLGTDPRIGCLSLQHSPEHAVVEEFEQDDQRWPLKTTERGCALLFTAERFQELRPLPVEKLLDFDWWVMRDAPRSLQQQKQLVAVRPGAARHLGWRAGDSTWQAIETPEFEEFRV